MAWTTPRTWVTNELVTAAIMNAHVRDNLGQIRYLFEGGLSTTPPASPADGQLWAMAPAGTFVWLFRYNAGSASAAKWEFAGGTVWQAEIGGAEGIAAFTNVWTDATTPGPSLTVPRAGDYLVWFAASGYNSTPAAQSATSRCGRNRSARRAVAEIMAPSTNPACTGAVSHAAAAALKCHWLASAGTTAEAENHTPMDST